MLYNEIMDTLNERIIECETAIDNGFAEDVAVNVARRDAYMVARRLLISLNNNTPA